MKNMFIVFLIKSIPRENLLIRMYKLILIFFVFIPNAFSQNLQADSDSIASKDSLRIFKLSVISNVENARIFFDTLYIGVTPVYNFNVYEGHHKIKVYSPVSLKNWESENFVTDVFINEDTTLNFNFRYFYYFNSDPFGAKVYLRTDSLLGITPLRIFTDERLTGNVIFKKKNFKDYLFDLSEYDFENGLNVSLKTKGSEHINDVVYKNKGTQFNTKRSLVPIISLSVASVAGGFFAISFKNKANDAYNNYLLTGDNSKLEESQKNDKYFVISLVLMQAAVGTLIYFLFFD